MSHGTGQQTTCRAESLSLDRLRLQTVHLWMSIPVFLVAWMGFMHPLRKLDFWWHLKVGEVIFSTGEIPRVDFFSFTHAGRPFFYQQWLGEVLYYLTYRVGGFPLLIALNTVLLLLTLVFVFHLCLEAMARPRVASLCSLVAAIVLGLYSNVRPQSYSFVLFAAFYWILRGYCDRRRDRLWALPLLMIPWVNLHGAFILGIGMIGVVLGTETIRRMLWGPRADTLPPSALAKLALVLVLTVLASLANPEGYHIFAYVRQLQVDPSSQLFVTEWQVPDIKKLGDALIFFGPFFLTLLVFFYSRRRLSLTELGLFLTFAVLGLGAMRNGIWFALIAAPMLAQHLNELDVPNLLDEMRARPHPGTLVQGSEPQRPSRRPIHYRLNGVILLSLVLFTVMLSPWVRPHLQAERLNPQLIEQGTPVGAMDYIAEQHLEGNIFHPQAYGDYLIWRLWPQQRSFLDGRVHLYGRSFVQDYILAFHDDRWESRLAKYDIRYLLLPKDDKNAASMIKDAQGSANWKLTYEDSISVLFEKQTH